MYEHDATEIAYRNGYEAGKKEAIKEIEANGERTQLIERIIGLCMEIADVSIPNGDCPYAYYRLPNGGCTDLGCRECREQFMLKMREQIAKEEAVSALEMKAEKDGVK